jgi:hypothetical protein
MPYRHEGTHDEHAFIANLLERIIRECPQRRPASGDERQAQLIAREEFSKLGLATETMPFRFNESLYANIALHFGLSNLGTAVSGLFPLAGLFLHLLAGLSYWADSTRRAYVLRRLLPFNPSQNIIATLHARGKPALRIVFLAHADAAFTGLMFDPAVIKLITRKSPLKGMLLGSPMGLATKTQFALAGFDLLRIFLGPCTWPLRPVEAVLSTPSLVAFLLALQVVLRDEVVPGANDDLSGVVALPLLAQRIKAVMPSNVEFVFVVTGCEEASLGGSDFLARAMQGVWRKDCTVIIGLDGLTNGELCYTALEGEVAPTPISPWLESTLLEVAHSDPRFAHVRGIEVPVGGTDVGPFLLRGWTGTCLVCADPLLGVPRHYHTPEDSFANLSIEKILLSIAFAERLVHTIVRRRVG